MPKIDYAERKRQQSLNNPQNANTTASATPPDYFNRGQEQLGSLPDRAMNEISIRLDNMVNTTGSFEVEVGGGYRFGMNRGPLQGGIGPGAGLKLSFEIGSDRMIRVSLTANVGAQGKGRAVIGVVNGEVGVTGSRTVVYENLDELRSNLRPWFRRSARDMVLGLEGEYTPENVVGNETREMATGFNVEGGFSIPGYWGLQAGVERETGWGEELRTIDGEVFHRMMEEETSVTESLKFNFGELSGRLEWSGSDSERNVSLRIEGGPSELYRRLKGGGPATISADLVNGEILRIIETGMRAQSSYLKILQEIEGFFENQPNLARNNDEGLVEFEVPITFDFSMENVGDNWRVTDSRLSLGLSVGAENDGISGINMNVGMEGHIGLREWIHPVSMSPVYEVFDGLAAIHTTDGENGRLDNLERWMAYRELHRSELAKFIVAMGLDHENHLGMQILNSGVQEGYDLVRAANDIRSQDQVTDDHLDLLDRFLITRFNQNQQRGLLIANSPEEYDQMRAQGQNPYYRYAGGEVNLETSLGQGFPLVEGEREAIAAGGAHPLQNIADALLRGQRVNLTVNLPMFPKVSSSRVGPREVQSKTFSFAPGTSLADIIRKVSNWIFRKYRFPASLPPEIGSRYFSSSSAWAKYQSFMRLWDNDPRTRSMNPRLEQYGEEFESLIEPEIERLVAEMANGKIYPLKA